MSFNISLIPTDSAAPPQGQFDRGPPSFLKDDQEYEAENFFVIES